MSLVLLTEGIEPRHEVAELDIVLLDGHDVVARRQGPKHITPGPSAKDDDLAVGVAQHRGQDTVDPGGFSVGFTGWLFSPCMRLQVGPMTKLARFTGSLSPLKGTLPFPSE